MYDLSEALKILKKYKLIKLRFAGRLEINSTAYITLNGKEVLHLGRIKNALIFLTVEEERQLPTITLSKREKVIIVIIWAATLFGALAIFYKSCSY